MTFEEFLDCFKDGRELTEDEQKECAQTVKSMVVNELLSRSMNYVMGEKVDDKLIAELDEVQMDEEFEKQVKERFDAFGKFIHFMAS